MAEIRKFVPAAGGPIAEAIVKAMGEPVRPVTPGSAGPGPEPESGVGNGVETPMTPAAIMAVPAGIQFLVRKTVPTKGTAD